MSETNLKITAEDFRQNFMEKKFDFKHLNNFFQKIKKEKLTLKEKHKFDLYVEFASQLYIGYKGRDKLAKHKNELDKIKILIQDDSNEKNIIESTIIEFIKDILNGLNSSKKGKVITFLQNHSINKIDENLKVLITSIRLIISLQIDDKTLDEAINCISYMYNSIFCNKHDDNINEEKISNYLYKNTEMQGIIYYFMNNLFNNTNNDEIKERILETESKLKLFFYRQQGSAIYVQHIIECIKENNEKILEKILEKLDKVNDIINTTTEELFKYHNDREKSLLEYKDNEIILSDSKMQEDPYNKFEDFFNENKKYDSLIFSSGGRPVTDFIAITNELGKSSSSNIYSKQILDKLNNFLEEHLGTLLDKYKSKKELILPLLAIIYKKNTSTDPINYLYEKFTNEHIAEIEQTFEEELKKLNINKKHKKQRKKN